MSEQIVTAAETGVERTKQGVGLARDATTGTISLAEGGRYVLNEAAGDLARMSDDDLRTMRKTFIEKRSALRTAQAELGDADRYGSPEGAALLDDKYYYDMLISRLESEMACRLITLD